MAVVELATKTRPVAVIVQQGKVLDFIDGQTQREETPEEYVRQEIAKSLVREYGFPKRDIAVEFTLRLGSKKPRADLVVFAMGDDHHQANSYIIVECKEQKVKANDRTDGVGQLQSYMAACPNAIYGMWTNGIERFCYRKVENKGKISFEEIPDIPDFGQSGDVAERPLFDQLKPASSDALLFAFRRCHNYIAGNQGLQKPQAFWELLKLIFCKIHDERESAEVSFYAAGNERNGINGPLKVKKRIDVLFEQVKKDYPAIFSDNDVVALKPQVLAYIVSQLQMYSLLESDVDVKGHAYEEIVGSNLRGDRGEFFTPRNVCNMAVAMLDPSENQLILDPACGTGGFLIAAMNRVIEKIRTAELARWKGDVKRAEPRVADRVKKFASQFMVGIDFNPELVKATKMNMVMNNDGAGGLYQANSLASPATWEIGLRERNLIGNVDIIFTNPPFGSKIPIDDQAILEKFDLGHWSYNEEEDTWTMGSGIQRSQPPEILFIERCVKFLKPGTGRVAMVLPDGILGSPGLGYVREWILTHTRILASIDMHPDTFQPNVSVQTSVLLLERKTDEQVALEEAAGRKNDYSVFMAVASHIGHDKRGNRTYVRDKKGNEIVEEVEETVKEYLDGSPLYKKQKTQRKVVDDNTIQIAQGFRKWLSEQD
ncbi:N-6 DNA methylase [Roseomonas haemaphysalidis]|uniref:N-6 DNA methylase n=1 Tax=Roseomonas haemaphysalidis TaxID=2768162 RepID=UPI001A97885F|nr:N-6 DNA methylase [Roseomonas haemaphysalidis]